MITLNSDAISDILEYFGVEIYGETGQDFIAYCPFHANRDTPAFNMGKEEPYPWRCWNTSCGLSGTVLRFVELAGEMTPAQAMRFLIKYQTDPESLKKKLDKVVEPEYEPWPEEMLDRVRIDYDKPHVVIDYMLGRGFSLDTIRYFEIGYSEVQDRIVIPVRDESGALVGFSGRALREEQYPKYWDKGLPKRFVLFNLNNCVGKDVIVTEGPLDAMMVHQAGFPDVVAIFGGGFAGGQREKLTRFVRSCIIFTDNPAVDEAGAELLEKISTTLQRAGKEIFVASYPPHVKDPGEMSEKQIQDAINNRKSILRLKMETGGII